VAAFEGTDDGPQENHGIIRLGVPGSPFRLEWIQRCDRDDPEHGRAIAALDRVAICVDPTVSEHEQVPTTDEACECGIVAAGFHAARRRMYALEDASLTAAPHVWADRVVDLVIRHKASEVVAEDNNGGALLRIVLQQALRARRAEIAWAVKITLCHAERDKLGRATLAAPCWQQGKVWHVGSPRGWVSLEGQLVQLDPNRPIRSQKTDRLDAVVWAALTFFGDGTDRKAPFPLDGAERWAQIVRAVGASREHRPGQPLPGLPRRR
jgi:phage terminase large subunit-like protein